MTAMAKSKRQSKELVEAISLVGPVKAGIACNTNYQTIQKWRKNKQLPRTEKGIAHKYRQSI